VKIDGPVVGWTRLGLPVLFESVHELAVVKPAGVATELTSDPRGVSLLARVDAATPARVVPRLPHRLDRVTRGIVVIALTDEAVRFHNEQLRAGRWEKVYLARVAVNPGMGRRLLGTHTLHLRTRDRRAEVVQSGGKRAVTEILALAAAPGRPDEAHVLLRLHTGRYHQVRATMAALGAPLVDDWLYGIPSTGRGERFYLEHVALRFTPWGDRQPRAVHWREDPDREPLDPALRASLDRIVEGWEGRDAEKR